MTQTAVLIIDVQSALFGSDPKLFEAEVVIKRIKEITRWARLNGHPVIFFQHEAPRPNLSHKTDDWSLEAGLTVKDQDKFVRKSTPDSFLKTDLEDILYNYHIEHLIICGYASEFCVDTTVHRSGH